MLKFKCLIISVLAVSVVGSSGQNTNALEQLREELRQAQESFERSQSEYRERIDSLSRKIEALSSGAEIASPHPHEDANASPHPEDDAHDHDDDHLASEGHEQNNFFPGLHSGDGKSYLDIGLTGTFAVGTSTAKDVAGRLELGGHDPNQRGFTVQALEAAFSGVVDPYLRGEAHVLFSIDSDGESLLELEEAWLETLDLPGNLTLRAGQILTQFGQHNPSHPHTWAFVDTPLVVGRAFGPDGLRNPGARLTWQAPTPFYSRLMLGIQDSHGETAYSFRDSGDGHDHGFEEELPLAYRHPDNDRGVRHFQDLLLSPRYSALFRITEHQTLSLGVSAAFGPNSRGGEGAGNTDTQVYGVDLDWRWNSHQKPGSFVAFQTEALLRRYEAGRFDWDENGNGVTDPGEVLDDTTGLPAILGGEVLVDYGFYSQLLYGFNEHWIAGLRFDYVGSDRGSYERRALSLDGDPLGRDPLRAQRWRLSPNLTWHPTHFSKVRLQYNYDDRRGLGEDHSVWLQFEFVLGGAHSSHHTAGPSGYGSHEH